MISNCIGMEIANAIVNVSSTSVNNDDLANINSKDETEEKKSAMSKKNILEDAKNVLDEYKSNPNYQVAIAYLDGMLNNDTNRRDLLNSPDKS